MKIVSSAFLQYRGLELMGFNQFRQASVRAKKNAERFASHFVARPIVYAVLWEDLQTTSDDELRIDDATDKELDDFLMSIYYLAKYPTENEMEGKFGYSDKTVRKWVWGYYLPRIFALREEKICWPLDWDSIFIITVDGVHCKIAEPQHGEFSKDREYWSHKFGSAGLNYEIAISIYDQRVVWINGPFKAGKHTDIRVFRSALKAMIPEGKLAVADLGYRGESLLISNPNSHDVAEVRLFKSRILARHESFNGKVKMFRIIKDTFRHGVEKHQIAFMACCVIGQYQLENGSPLFDA